MPNMDKNAYVPLTPAAEQQLNNPQAMPPQGAPMPAGQPMPPEGAAGMPAPQIQTVQGPNGEPIDPETGMIVVDPQNGIEQDPITGILFSKFTNEFATPEGQPIPPDQAIAMLQQGQAAAAQGQGAPMPPQGAPMPEQGMPAPMPEQGMMDPMAQMPPEGIDPATGLPMGEAPMGDMPPEAMQEMPAELMQMIEDSKESDQRQDKNIDKIISDVSGVRADIQGLRRDVQNQNDKSEALLSRLTAVLDIIENSVR